MTRTQDVTFTFRGMKIKTFKPGLHCSSCYKKEAVKKIKDLMTQGYFSICSGKISIDWKKCLDAYSYQGRWNNDFDDLLSLFIKLEVLSLEMSRNFVIHRFSSDFTLRTNGFEVYFADKANAQGFIDAYVARYGGTGGDMVAAQFV
jgi:hypothetical protein